MAMKCSVCGGQVTNINGKLKCEKCGRSKDNNEPSTVHEVDLNDDTKDLDILTE